MKEGELTRGEGGVLLTESCLEKNCDVFQLFSLGLNCYEHKQNVDTLKAYSASLFHLW